MKTKLLASALLCSCLTTPAVFAAELDTLEKKANYWMGMKIGVSLDGLGYELDEDALRQGFEDATKESDRALSDEDIRQSLGEIQQRFEERQAAEAKSMADANKKAGADFLAENADKEGVMTTDSGLQYKILEAGNGPKPEATDIVKVNYRGMLLDGTEFDSSYAHGGPATFPLNGVIDGWTEGLQHIPEGSKAELYIPSELGYGADGMGPIIGPHSTLVFEVELLEVNPEPPAETATDSTATGTDAAAQ